MKASFETLYRVAAVCLMAGCFSACATLSGPSRSEQASQWVGIAAAALGEGDVSGSLQALQKAEELNAKDAQLHHVRAHAFLARKDSEAALKSAQIALSLEPTDSTIRTTLGRLLMDSGKYREAETVLLPAANDTIYRDSYRARTNLAIIYRHNGELNLAREQLNKAINEAPTLACHAYYLRSELDLKAGRIQEALKDLGRATVQSCSSYAEAHLAVGIALARNRQFDRARNKFLEVSQRFKGTEFAEKALENLRYLP